MRILVADDDAIIRTLLKGSLTKWGYEVVPATNGEEAWSILNQPDAPRLAVVDWMMPGLQGVDLCKRLRESRRGAYIYVILLTSKQSKEDVVAGLDAGADDFLSKPVNANELRSRIAVGVRMLEYEAALKQANKEREIYYMAFENSAGSICITDTEGRISHVNKAWEELYGYGEDEVKGEEVSLLNPSIEACRDLGYSDDDYRALYEGMWHDLRDPRVGHWEGEVPNQTKAGELRWVRVASASIREKSGDTIAFVSLPVDMTRKRREELIIRMECYRAIAELAEMRDNETGNHLHRMATYSCILAREMGMSRKFIEDIEIFAPLHDIGKVGIVDAILRAPRKLTDEEFDIMKTHANLGYSILKDRPTLEMAADIANGHHERYDGSGYPNGFKGEEIPLSARIVAVADVYDAFRSKRPYKLPWPHEKAVEEIQRSAGSHFDPQVVEAFMHVKDELFEISERMMD